MRYTLVIPLILALGSCSSPPKPPLVDPANRRPANGATEVEAQSCRSELQNTRILANENSRTARMSRDYAARLADQLRATSTRGTCTATSRNTIYSILFAFGSSRVPLPSDASALIEQARQAPLVLLSGRTDGTVATSAESRIALERAAAVRSWLVQGGVDPARIRTTWQPVGDHAADNSVAAGRSLNRRVEVEIYPAAPQVASLGVAQM